MDKTLKTINNILDQPNRTIGLAIIGSSLMLGFALAGIYENHYQEVHSK